jgi:hypothetical protein
MRNILFIVLFLSLSGCAYNKSSAPPSPAKHQRWSLEYNLITQRFVLWDIDAIEQGKPWGDSYEITSIEQADSIVAAILSEEKEEQEKQKRENEIRNAWIKLEYYLNK